MVRQHHDKKKHVGGGAGRSDDFKRKVVKVGRKVQRNNVTKITVTSKKLSVPLQNNVTSVINAADESAVIGSLAKQLSHYSESNRTNALRAIGQFLNESSNPESFIGTYSLHFNIFDYLLYC